MSYDIELVDPVTKVPLELDEPHQLRGGSYVVGGTPRASLNVTYNYYKHLQTAFANAIGIRTLYGLTGAESLQILDQAIARLSDDADPDYWKATEGNAKRALLQLRALAVMRPDGMWAGD